MNYHMSSLRYQSNPEDDTDFFPVKVRPQSPVCVRSLTLDKTETKTEWTTH